MPSDPYYRTPQWKRLVALVWQRAKGYCEAPGCVSLGKTVDHIVSRRKGGRDALDNLRLLCKTHDNQVMQDQHGNRRNGGVFKGCDASGMPTDPNHPWNQP